MKALSIDAVNTVMEFLILTFGKTTSLDVKNNLRKLGFEAKQADVSKIMNDIAARWSEDYEYSLDGKTVKLVTAPTTQNRKTFNVYQFQAVEAKTVKAAVTTKAAPAATTPAAQPTVNTNPRDYIRRRMNTPSATLARALGISAASVAAYKANINR